jgi:phosphoglucosamine mutase
MLAEAAVRRLARAIARVLDARDRFPTDIPSERGRSVFIGRDTRASGPLLHAQVAGELIDAGYDVGDLGVIPTPGVAYLASTSSECCLAIVLSASHNHARDNGIKLLSATGTKISEEFELAVSQAFHENGGDAKGTESAVERRGKSRDLSDRAFESYVTFLVDCCERPERLAGKKVVIDTANGAAYRTGPELFRRLGMDVETVADEPNGDNINDGCGALHPELLAKRVLESGAVVGFCFDGDADRMIPVSSAGTVLDGDHVLALAARHYDRKGRLPNKAVVTTVMANVGLEKSVRAMGLELRRTPVGDKHVHRVMVEEGHPIGGEQSGHLIFLDLAGTGDGVLAAIRLLDVLEGDDLDLENEAKIVTKYPQVLKNVRVRERVPFAEIAEITRAVENVESRLAGDGRVVLRYSGTEPLARVMLEGPDQATIDAMCDEICAVIQERLGS